MPGLTGSGSGSLGAGLGGAIGNVLGSQSQPQGQGIHGIDVKENGSGVIRWGNGAQSTFRNAGEMSKSLSQLTAAFGMPDNMDQILEEAGLEGVQGTNADGTPYFDLGPKGSHESGEPPQGTTVRADSSSSSPSRAARGGAASAANEAARTAGRTGGTTQTTQGTQGGTAFDGGTSGGGGGGGASPQVFPETPINLNDPAGIGRDPGPLGIGGGGVFGGGASSPNQLPGLPSFLDSLPPNATLQDVLTAVQRQQEAGFQAGQDIFQGIINRNDTDPNAVALRGATADRLANPESLDEATVNRLIGQGREAAGTAGATLANAQRQSAASLGVGRDVGERAAQQTERSTAAQQAALERSTRIQSAIQNFQDRGQALGQAGTQVGADLGRFATASTDAVRNINENQQLADTFFQNQLAGGGGSGNRVATPASNSAAGGRSDISGLG